jgi:hypothetical protein
MLRVTDPGLRPDLEDLLRHHLDALRGLAQRPGIFDPVSLPLPPPDKAPMLARWGEWWYLHRIAGESIKAIARSAFPGSVNPDQGHPNNRRHDVLRALKEIQPLLDLMDLSVSPIS